MSMQSFQRAIVELTLAPLKARALREGQTGMLADYDLTACERDRILDIVRQPGISANCSLSRGNRFEVILGAFPMTCVLLARVLRGLLDKLWEEHSPANYQLTGEEIAFASMIEGELAKGELSVEYLPEVFAYEMTCMRLVRRMRSRSDPHARIEAVVEFQHSPDELLPPLSRLTVPRSGLPKGSYRARVELRGEQFEVELLEPALN